MPRTAPDGLSRVSALSLDAYGTLLDLDACSSSVEAGVFGLAGVETPPASGELWRRISADVFNQFREFERGSVPFRTVAEMMEQAYARTLPEFGLGRLSPREAAAVVLEAHGTAPPYSEAIPFLAKVGVNLDLCVSSDADRGFLDRALAHAGLNPYLPFRICSEAIRTYKVDPSGRFFEAVLGLLGRRPEEVAHVGDGESDVVGAKRAGLVAVWVHRHKRPWARVDFSPDVVVADLDELAARLDSAVKARAGRR